MYSNALLNIIKLWAYPKLGSHQKISELRHLRGRTFPGCKKYPILRYLSKHGAHLGLWRKFQKWWDFFSFFFFAVWIIDKHLSVWFGIKRHAIKKEYNVKLTISINLWYVNQYHCIKDLEIVVTYPNLDLQIICSLSGIWDLGCMGKMVFTIAAFSLTI